MEGNRKSKMMYNGSGLMQKREKNIYNSKITKECDLYKVWHLGIPSCDSNDWSISIEGGRNGQFIFHIEDLKKMTQISITSVQECAGSPIYPEIPQRRVGNVIWKGVLLRDILDIVGVEDHIKYIYSRGADNGYFNGRRYDCYEKDLPIDMALSSNTLLALEINGRPLPVERGGPVRLVVAGYYGTNSVKWVNRVKLAERRHDGDFTTIYYNDVETVNNIETVTPVWALKPNSIIVSPDNASILSKTETIIWGWAWGFYPIERVEVSFNGGLTWEDASVEKRVEKSWQRFEIRWLPCTIGEYHIIVRATDVVGNVQPLLGKRNLSHSSIVLVN